MTPEVFNGFYFKTTIFDKNYLDLIKVSMLVTWQTNVIAPEIKPKH
jgi:hypothetical protein